MSAAVLKHMTTATEGRVDLGSRSIGLVYDGSTKAWRQEQAHILNSKPEAESKLETVWS